MSLTTNPTMIDNKDSSEESSVPNPENVRIENRMKMRKYCVNLQAKINNVVEGHNPTNILGLPKEVWENVFGNLDDITDIKNCFDTCHQFRSSLSRSQKTLLQLKKVLPILLPLGYLNIKSIFDLRLVSKNVCQFTNQYLESRRSWVRVNVPPIVYALLPQIYNFDVFKMRIKFGCKAKIQVLIRKPVLSAINTTNPFLSRYLLILNGTCSAEIMFRNVIDLLEGWGDQIWYLEFSMNCTKEEFLQIIRLLPNLKYAKLYGKINDGEGKLLSHSDLLKEACPKVVSW